MEINSKIAQSILNKYSGMRVLKNLCILALDAIQSLRYQSLRYNTTIILILYRFVVLHQEFHKLNLLLLNVAKKERVMH